MPDDVCKTYQTFYDGLKSAGATVQDTALTTPGHGHDSHVLLHVDGHSVHCYFWGAPPSFYNVSVTGIAGSSRSVTYHVREDNALQQANKVVSRIRMIQKRHRSAKGAGNLSKKYAKKIKQETGLEARVGVSDRGHVRWVRFGPEVLKRLGVELDAPKKSKNPPSLWDHLDADN